MNLLELKTIINSSYPKEIIESKIIECLSKDKDVIKTMLLLLEKERQFEKDLKTEMNVLLSKADTALDNPHFNEENFIQKEVESFYKKYKPHIGNCFKRYSWY